MECPRHAVASESSHAVRLMRRHTSSLLYAVAAATVVACASPGLPPGGPEDKDPPELVSVLPDTGMLNLRPREVLFRFSEVVSERPKGAQTLDQLVVVSPTSGPINVDWRRETIAVRPKAGWRPNTTYTVTILPGLADLAGNALRTPLHTVFSTGPTLANGTLSGLVFDWVGNKVAVGARVQATTGGDTLLRYVATVDSSGKYTLSHLPAGEFRLRAFLDLNNNRNQDRTEKWDSVTVSGEQTKSHEFYLFEHDSVGPGISEVTAADSLTLRVKFSRPLQPGAALDSSNFTVRLTKDSTFIQVLAANSSEGFDSLAAMRKKLVADSALRADTSAKGRAAQLRADSLRGIAVKDSIKKVQDAAIAAARDTVTRIVQPKSNRAVPIAEVILRLAAPLNFNIVAEVTASDITGLAGARRTTKRILTRKPPPPPKDTTATKKAAAPGKATTDTTKKTPEAPPLIKRPAR